MVPPPVNFPHGSRLWHYWPSSGCVVAHTACLRVLLPCRTTHHPLKALWPRPRGYVCYKSFPPPFSCLLETVELYSGLNRPSTVWNTGHTMSCWASAVSHLLHVPFLGLYIPILPDSLLYLNFILLSASSAFRLTLLIIHYLLHTFEPSVCLYPGPNCSCIQVSKSCALPILGFFPLRYLQHRAQISAFDLHTFSTFKQFFLILTFTAFVFVYHFSSFTA